MMQYMNDLDAIAEKLNTMKFDINCSWHYHAFLDAIVWSDEESTLQLSDSPAVGYLFVYRMGVLLGVPNVNIEPLWLYAKRKFPRWPGFETSRCSYSPELAASIETARTNKISRIMAEDHIHALLRENGLKE